MFEFKSFFTLYYTTGYRRLIPLQSNEFVAKTNIHFYNGMDELMQ